MNTYIRNGRLDLLAGRALFAPIFDSPARPANAARFTFLDPAAAEFYPDWDAVADQNVASLRAEVGRNPCDKALSDLIGELSTRGDTAQLGLPVIWAGITLGAAALLEIPALWLIGRLSRRFSGYPMIISGCA